MDEGDWPAVAGMSTENPLPVWSCDFRVTIGFTNKTTSTKRGARRMIAKMRAISLGFGTRRCKERRQRRIRKNLKTYRGWSSSRFYDAKLMITERITLDTGRQQLH